MSAVDILALTTVRALAAGMAVAWVAAVAIGAQSGPIQRVAWLQGCWAMTSADTTVEEQWMAPRGGSMLGAGRGAPFGPGVRDVSLQDD